MFVPSGSEPIVRHLRAELLERFRGDPGVGAVRAVDDDLQAREVAAEALDDVLEVALRRDGDVVDSAPAIWRSVLAQERLDLLLGRVGQLAALAVEELDAVVLRRVVRSRDDGPEVEREQRDRGRRQHAGEDRVPARRDDTAAEGLLELLARGARVAADEDPAALRPQRRRAAEPLHELERDVFADDSPHAVRSEIPSRHGGGDIHAARSSLKRAETALSARIHPRVSAGLAGQAPKRSFSAC